MMAIFLVYFSSKTLSEFRKYISQGTMDIFFNFGLIGKGHDLVSLNVQRGRDHGLPGYNAFRQFFGLAPILSMDQRPEEIAPDTWDSFKLVYREPDDIDIFPAGLAETPLSGMYKMAIINVFFFLNSQKISALF